VEIQEIKNNPFTDSKFLEFVTSLSNHEKFEIFKKGYFLDNGVLYNIGNRDYVDYRPSLKITQKDLEKRGISFLHLDSLIYEQVKDISKNIEYKDLIIKKSDYSIRMNLPASYDLYLENLGKKKRHELKRKKSKFFSQLEVAELQSNKDKEIFQKFVEQHKLSDGEKGTFMNQEVELFFKNLLTINGWRIYFIENESELISSAFVYENKNGCYLYNSTKNSKYNSINPGIVLIDLIIQKMIKEKKVFFDFLKGYDRYKLDLGGSPIQLYDIKISI
tara:strand:- start:224 stop:1048 length:825 start_codon:yes stop_codon:yes gene_type:complete